MLSLAVNYRPKTFEDVVEQDAIKLILKEQINTKTQKNAYLFTGGAGTGKTTCARIFANELNHGEGHPIEVDAASNNGVEDVRKIISESKFKSLDSEFRCYIIDECHMLSIGAWNALLKLLEEPPVFTIFILCTTDPQKIPATILSRVQRYDFQKISFKAITERLNYIAEEENKKTPIKYEKESLEYIAKIADGGMRDAITLLDKCISFNSILNIENVTKALGTVNYNIFFELLNNITKNNTNESIKIIEDSYNSGKDIKQFIKQFLYFLVDVKKYTLYNNFDYIQIPQTYKDDLEIIKNLESNIILTTLQNIAKLDSELKYNSSPKKYIELFLILLN